MSALLYKAGSASDQIVSWHEFEDKNPVRRRRVESDLKDKIRAIAFGLDKPIEIAFPPFPVHIQTEDFFPGSGNAAFDMFAIGAPGILTRLDKDCTSSPGWSMKKWPNFAIVYPDGLQVRMKKPHPIHGDQLPQKSSQFMKMYNKFRLGSYGDACQPVEIFRSYALWLPVPVEQSERFFDAAYVENYSESWQKDPGVTVQVACEPTLSLLGMSRDKPWPDDFICPLTRIYVRYGSGELVFELEWDGQDYQVLTAPLERTYQPANERPSYSSTNTDLAVRPHEFELEACGSGNEFVHRYDEQDVTSQLRVLDSGFDYSKIKLNNTGYSFEVCTTEPEQVGTTVKITWVTRN